MDLIVSSLDWLYRKRGRLEPKGFKFDLKESFLRGSIDFSTKDPSPRLEEFNRSTDLMSSGSYAPGPGVSK